MPSWRYWSVLHYPPTTHPLFRRIASTDYQIKSITPNWRISKHLVAGLVLSALLLLLLLDPQVLMFVIFILPMLLATLVVVTPFLLINLVNLVGIFWSAQVAATIVQERDLGRYDLLCLLPDGASGVNFAISSGCLHRGGLFAVLHSITRVIMVIALLLLLILLVVAVGGIIASNRSTSSLATNDLKTLVEAAVIVIAYFIHYRQSVVLSPLVGMFASTYTANTNEARLFASFVYITIQLLTYGVIWFIGNHLLSMIYAAFLAPDSWLYLTLPPIILALFVGIREACILGVWCALKHRVREYTRDSGLVPDRV